MQDCLSPVYAASQEGHTEVVDLLVQAGADIHLATTDEVHVSTVKLVLSDHVRAKRIWSLNGGGL